MTSTKDSKSEEQESKMNGYRAIMRAASAIESNPKLYCFDALQVPRCGSPGCLWGHIGIQLGLPHSTLNYEVAEAVGVNDTNHLYRFLMEGDYENFTKNARTAAKGLRAYAAAFFAPQKPKRTDAELVRHWTAVVRQKALDEHAQSEELAW